MDRSLRRISFVIAAFALAFIGVFVGAVTKQLASKPPKPANELVVIVPTMPSEKEKQPLSRSFEQVAGLMMGLEDLGNVGHHFAVRAEYVPNTELDAASMSLLVDKRTRALVAPGRSSDVHTLFVERCNGADCALLRDEEGKPRPLVLISSTSSELREKLQRQYAVFAALGTNDQLASAIVNVIMRWGREQKPAIRPVSAPEIDVSDRWYATELAEKVIEQLAGIEPANNWLPSTRESWDGIEPIELVRILIGDDEWSKTVGDGLRAAKLVVLADGLNSPTTVDRIRQKIEPGTEMRCVNADARSAMEKVLEPGERAFKNIDDPEFAWSNLARATVRQLVTSIVSNRPMALVEVGFVVTDCK